MDSKAYLVLENGKVFEGYSFGAAGEVTGEIVFTTGMTGYLETLTDKSYYGQIIVQTYPLIGNYGVIPEDFEGKKISARGYIVREWCENPSNFRSEKTIDEFLKEQGIIGLCGIDTRALTKTLRDHGTMNGIITTDPDKVDFNSIRAYSIKDAVKSVSSDEPCIINPEGKYSIALMDFGYKQNILRELIKRDCKITLLPYDTTPGRIKELSPDGIMLTNGPGDPADNPEIIRNLKEISSFKIPTFGICLGHQLLALSFGFKTEKLKFGHRGANQPVKDLESDRIYISSQNHGYAVNIDSIDCNISDLWFVNLNDNTCEGIKYKDYPIFSVQFHPEGCGGPQDTAFLFDSFIHKVDEYCSLRSKISITFSR